MNSLTINVKPRPGSDIEDVFKGAIRIAQINNCIVEFVFNGATCFARFDGCAELGVENYHKALKMEKQFARCY